MNVMRSPLTIELKYVSACTGGGAVLNGVVTSGHAPSLDRDAFIFLDPVQTRALIRDLARQLGDVLENGSALADVKASALLASLAQEMGDAAYERIRQGR